MLITPAHTDTVICECQRTRTPPIRDAPTSR